MEFKLEKDRLANITNYDDFFALSREFSKVEESVLFDFLFPLALEQRTSENTNGIAGLLLIEIDPKPTKILNEIMKEIALSKWFVSNREIPFYLASNFGKWNVIKAYNEYIESNDLTEDQLNRFQTIVYWVSSPAAKLCYDLHYWEWQEVIEADA